MDNAFNSPLQVLDANMKAGEGKVKLPLLKCILLGIMAGAFIAFGGASSNAAVHNIADQGLLKTLAGCIFPVGLMMIVFVGGELFTGDCLMIAGVVDKRFSAVAMIKTLIIVFFSNMVGAVIIAALVYFSGLLDYDQGGIWQSNHRTFQSSLLWNPLQYSCVHGSADGDCCEGYRGEGMGDLFPDLRIRHRRLGALRRQYVLYPGGYHCQHE